MEGVPIYNGPNPSCGYCKPKKGRNLQGDLFRFRCCASHLEIIDYPKQHWIFGCPERFRKCDNYKESLAAEKGFKLALKSASKKLKQGRVFATKHMLKLVNRKVLLAMIRKYGFEKIKPTKKMKRIAKVWYLRRV